MTTVTAVTRAAVVLASGSAMLVFSKVTFSTLVPMLVGIMLVLLGVAIAYRPSSVLGLLIVLTASALASDVATLTDIGGVLTATVTLFIPSLLMAWAALSSEPGDPYALRVRKRASVRLLAMAAACTFCVPAFAVCVGIVLPTASMGVSTMTEMSVLLLAAVTTALLLTRSAPATKAARPAPEE